MRSTIAAVCKRFTQYASALEMHEVDGAHPQQMYHGGMSFEEGSCTSMVKVPRLSETDGNDGCGGELQCER